MKKYGKIIIAFMWLGLTMIMIVGATFAWFADNRNVSADGMKFQAATTSNLEISTTAASGYASSASVTSALQSLTPASTTNLGSFFATKDSGQAVYETGVLHDNARLVDITPTTAPTEANAAVEHVVKYTFYIRTNGDTALTNLYLSAIEVTGAVDSQTGTAAAVSADISKALRIGVVCATANGGNATPYIYAPVGYAGATYIGGASANYKGITDTTSDTATALTGCVIERTSTNGTPYEDTVVNLKAAPADTDVLATSVPTGDGYVAIDVYVWYEGQDMNCTSLLASVEELNIKVTFATANN